MNQTFDALGLHHFGCRIDDDKVAWLAFDYDGAAVNKLSTAVLAELGHVLDFLAEEKPAGLVIYSGKAAGFSVGADINEVAQLDSPEKIQEFLWRGWTLFNRLAALPYPSLALIAGHCAGGGLELALACRYRLVVDRPDTLLSLPEVMLGIVPGWGGMFRLPALIGPPRALDMMLSGRAVDARRAVAIGLADAMVAPRLMNRAAHMLVLSRKPRPKARGVAAVLNHPLFKPVVVRQTRKKIKDRDPYAHYEAPRAILDIWSEHEGNALGSFAFISAIPGSTTTHNLLRVFRLRERLKALARPASPLPAVRHVHVIGAGSMGGDIAAWCALKGMTVTLQDQERHPISRAQGRARALFARRLKNLRMELAAFDRLIPDPAGHGIRHADIVIEAVTENAEIKRRVYAQVEPLLKPGAILATNTSSLSLESLRTDLSHPQRLVGIHFFNPVAKMTLVEIVETPDLDLEVKAAAHAFVGQIGKLGLPVQDAPGFLVNAVLAPYMLEAMRCVDEGIKPETVDAAMISFGMPMGPIELVDTVGLDIARDVGIQLQHDDTLPVCLQTHLARGDLGRKTGKGFYAWDGDKPVKGESEAIPVGLVDRLITPLIDKAQERVDDGVVADADLADAGIIFGTGFAPFRGGPLHYRRTGGSARPVADILAWRATE